MVEPLLMQGPGDIPPGAIEIAEAFFMMVVFIALGVPIIRMISKRLERAPAPALPTDLTARLERIEQGVEAMAIEIERISENQRFTTKLLAEQRMLPRAEAPAAPTDVQR